MTNNSNGLPALPQLTPFLSSSQPQVTGLSRDTAVVSSLTLSLPSPRPALRAEVLGFAQ